MKRFKCNSLNICGWELGLHSFDKLKPSSILNLFHYTNKIAKAKIVCESGIDFRLSQVGDFIDKNEGIQIIEPFYHACGRLHEQGKINDEFFKIARNITLLDIRSKHEETWILCMSQNGYSTYMKERYASKDGWIIGIQSYAFKDFEMSFDNTLGCINMVSVEYSHARMRRILESDLKKLYSWYCYDKNNNTFCSQEAVQQRLKEMIQQRLNFYRYCYKNSDYKHEEEIRIIANVKPDFVEWSSNEKAISLKRAMNNNKPELHLLLGNEYIYSISQKIRFVELTKLNKPFITAEEIKEARELKRK